jgi:hypothetical protein
VEVEGNAVELPENIAHCILTCHEGWETITEVIACTGLTESQRHQSIV